MNCQGFGYVCAFDGVASSRTSEFELCQRQCMKLQERTVNRLKPSSYNDLIQKLQTQAPEFYYKLDCCTNNQLFASFQESFHFYTNHLVLLYTLSVIIQLMASSYIQKYPIPQGFPLILKNFSREILRDQPSNIIEYAAKYFQALEKGQPFKYESAYNVPKEEKTYELKYQPQKAESMVRKQLRINNITGALSKKQMQKLTKLTDYIYTKYDKNNNGTLQSKELDQMIKQLYKEGHLNSLPNDLQKKEFVDKIDQNKNGKIERAELIVFLRRLVN